MTSVIVNGACGRMGTEVMKLVDKGYKDTVLAAGVDAGAFSYGIKRSLSEVEQGGDVIIDFSNHAATEELLKYAVQTGTPVVISTTGHTEEELAMIKEAAEKVPVFMSYNMSIGVALLCDLAKKAAAVFSDADVEIIETHHNRKQDAPSGTALMLADSIREARGGGDYVMGRSGTCPRQKGEIGIHAVRVGNVVGEHQVIIGTDAQTITLKHQAHDRALFAEGAITAAVFLKDKPAGLYSMKDMLKF